MDEVAGTPVSKGRRSTACARGGLRAIRTRHVKGVRPRQRHRSSDWPANALEARAPRQVVWRRRSRKEGEVWVRPDNQQKERSELKKRLKEISGQIRARSNELQQELSPENYKRVEDLIRLIESYDGVVVQLLKLPIGLRGGRSA